MSYDGRIHRGDWVGDRFEIIWVMQHNAELEEIAKMVGNKDATKEKKHPIPNGNEREKDNILAKGEEPKVEDQPDVPESWQDVTDECMQLLDDIWSVNFGRKWKKELAKKTHLDR
ncbi:hypothetical protein M422DRAFT_44596 [Sphaerobolus stellatus SS14]|nr:hypothetical protein M422DRAFT_44596 [Sphaerobolus stellatus SS14]